MVAQKRPCSRQELVSVAWVPSPPHTIILKSVKMWTVIVATSRDGAGD